MNKFFHPSILLGAAFLLAANIPAETESDSVQGVKATSFRVPAEADGHLNYAPEREVTVLHLVLDVTPDFDRRMVAGKATLQFKPNLKIIQAELRATGRGEQRLIGISQSILAVQAGKFLPLAIDQLITPDAILDEYD